MHADFWHDRWARERIGFHGEKPHDLLVQHWQALGIAKGSRVLVPLCGKSLDMPWLLSQGYSVVGVELSQKAVEQFFAALEITPNIHQAGAFQHYSAEGLDIFVGDMFAMTPEQVGVVDAVYDRAALVALPAEMRVRYATKVQALSHAAPQLLIAFEYDQAQMDGPPFSVDAAEVKRVYGNSATVTELARHQVGSDFRHLDEVEEVCWQLELSRKH